MTDHQLYCDVPDCNDPVNPGFPRPSFRNGKCSSHMKQLQRRGETAPIAERVSLREKLLEAYEHHFQADADEAYDRTWRHFLSVAKQMLGVGDRRRGEGRREVGEVIRQALARARASGKRVGRPPKVTTERVLEVMELVGSAGVTARLLGIHRTTVFRYLAVAKGRVSLLPSAEGPQQTG